MRLIDADRFKDGFNSDTTIGKTMRLMIDEQPTIDVEKMLVCNCEGCENNNTDECVHCMRAYSDCYKPSTNVAKKG